MKYSVNVAVYLSVSVRVSLEEKERLKVAIRLSSFKLNNIHLIIPINLTIKGTVSYMIRTY